MTTSDHYIHHRYGIPIAEMAAYDPHAEEATSSRTLLARFGLEVWRAGLWWLRGRGEGGAARNVSDPQGLPKNSA